MNKGIIWLIIIVIVTAIGGGGYYWQTNRIRTAGGGNEMSGSYAISGEVGGAKASAEPVSLKDLMASSKSQMCVLKFAFGGTEVEGVVYVISGQARGDFITKSATGQVKVRMIVKGGAVYNWTDNQRSGLKSPVVRIDSKLNYDCQPWTADNAKFELPSGVKF